MKFLSDLKAASKTRFRSWGQVLGIDVRRNNLHNRDELRLPAFLRDHNISVVLDIGANTGQFATALFDAGYSGDIVSFEALPEAHKALSIAASQRGRKWRVAPQCALSDQTGEATFYVTDSNTSSSLFAPSRAFVAASPQVRLSRTLTVPTARLDDVIAQTRLCVDGCFLKLDVQGAEALVLAGGPRALGSSSGIMTEVSLTPLYEGQPPAKDVLDAIYAAGFEVWDVWPGYRNPSTYRLNQVDLIFFKPRSLS